MAAADGILMDYESRTEEPYKSQNIFHAGMKYNDINNLQNILCDIAQMDAWHDHHSIGGLSNSDIQKLVSSGQVGCDRNRVSTDEPAFLNTIMVEGKKLKDRISVEPQSQLPEDFLKIITDRYDVRYVKCKSGKWNGNEYTLNGFTYKEEGENVIGTAVEPVAASQSEDENDDEGESAEPNEVVKNKIDNYLKGEQGPGSQLQVALKGLNINVPIYVFRDVAYGNFPDDTRLWKSYSADEKIITLIDSTCIYDPGPTLNTNTASGKRHGFSTEGSNSLYAVSYGRDMIDIPAWNDNPDLSPEKLMYTKNSCILHTPIPSLPDRVSTNDAKKFFDQMKSTLYVRRDDGTCMYIETSDTSNKAKSSNELQLREVIETIGCLWPKFPLDVPREIKENYGKIMTASGPMKILSKKFGDHGIALATLTDKIPYKLFVPQNGTGFVIEDGITNGLHMFLSYDAVAVRSALEYGSPMVCYNTHEGFALFVSKNITTKFGEPKKIFIQELQRMVLLISQYIKYSSSYQEAINQLNESINTLEYIKNIVSNIFGLTKSVDPTNDVRVVDMQFHTFLCTFHEFSQYITLYNQLNIKILNLRTDLFDNTTKFSPLVLELTALLSTITDENYDDNIENILNLTIDLFGEIQEESVRTITSSSESEKAILAFKILITDLIGIVNPRQEPQDQESIKTRIDESFKDVTSRIIELFNLEIFKHMRDVISSYNSLLECRTSIIKIDELFIGSLLRLDIFIAASAKPQEPLLEEQLIALYRTEDFETNLFNRLNKLTTNRKTTFFIQSKASIIRGITPYESTKNGRLTRLCMFGVGQKTINFGTSIIEEICKNLVSSSDLFDMFTYELTGFFAKCAGVATDMKEVLSHSIRDLTIIISRIGPSQGSSGGSKKNRTKRNTDKKRKHRTRNNTKIYGGSYIESLKKANGIAETLLASDRNPSPIDYKTYSRLMDYIGSAFTLYYVYIFLNFKLTQIRSEYHDVPTPVVARLNELNRDYKIINKLIHQIPRDYLKKAMKILTTIPILEDVEYIKDLLDFVKDAQIFSDVFTSQRRPDLLTYFIGSEYTDWGKLNRERLYEYHDICAKFTEEPREIEGQFKKEIDELIKLLPEAIENAPIDSIDIGYLLENCDDMIDLITLVQYMEPNLPKSEIVSFKKLDKYNIKYIKEQIIKLRELAKKNSAAIIIQKSVRLIRNRKKRPDYNERLHEDTEQTTKRLRVETNPNSVPYNEKVNIAQTPILKKRFNNDNNLSPVAKKSQTNRKLVSMDDFSVGLNSRDLERDNSSTLLPDAKKPLTNPRLLVSTGLPPAKKKPKTYGGIKKNTNKKYKKLNKTLAKQKNKRKTYKRK